MRHEQQNAEAPIPEASPSLDVADSIAEVLRYSYVSVERRPGAGVFAYHCIHLPSYNEKGRYRSMVSWSAFTNRGLNSLADVGKKRTFSSSWDYFQNHSLNLRITLSLEHVQISSVPNIFLLGDAPRFNHETIWDFYRAIGYDYRKKKYSLPPPIDAYGVDVGPVSVQCMLAIADKYWPN